MNNSAMTTSPTERPKGYIPKLRPNATIEEMDEWIITIGGRRLTPEEGREIVRSVKWANVPGENPGDPGFPFADRL